MAHIFLAQSLEALKEKYEDAVLITWVFVPPITTPPKDRPGMHLEHIFDFECGIRLLINRESHLPDGSNDWIHISGSCEPSLIHKHFNKPKVELEELLPLSVECMKLLIPPTTQITFLGMMHGIAHWQVLDSTEPIKTPTNVA